jgi:cytidine deaminase
MKDRVVEAAIAAREHAHAPFSGFRVGAAVEDEREQIFTGCNIENATYSLTLCAERLAIFKAISDGVRNFRRLVVAADSETLTPPCGACRQIAWEFGGNLRITLVNLKGKREDLQMADLFPRPFDASYL